MSDTIPTPTLFIRTYKKGRKVKISRLLGRLEFGPTPGPDGLSVTGRLRLEPFTSVQDSQEWKVGI